MSHRALARLIAATFAAAVLALVWPQPLGGRTSYLIVSGTSMEPRLRSLDAVAVRERSDYGVGDVVAYRVPDGEFGAGNIVIHRITAIDADGRLTTQGDNRAQPDLWRPTAADVVGTPWIHVPGGGRLLHRLGEPIVLAALIGGLVALSVALPTGAVELAWPERPRP